MTTTTMLLVVVLLLALRANAKTFSPP